MLCYFQDFQAESSPVLSEADIKEGLTWHVRGSSGLYLLCNNCDVQYFCRGTAEVLFNFYKHKNEHVCCHHSVCHHLVYLISLSLVGQTSVFYKCK